MDNTILVALIGAIAGLISGTIASLIAPWIKWGIEKKKLLLNERKLLLKDVREIIIKEYDENEKFNEMLALNPDSTKDKKIYPKALSYYDMLQKYSQFQRIIPFLDTNIKDGLINAKLLSLSDRGSKLGEMPLPLVKLLDNINTIEKKWGLLK